MTRPSAAPGRPLSKPVTGLVVARRFAPVFRALEVVNIADYVIIIISINKFPGLGYFAIGTVFSRRFSSEKCPTLTVASFFFFFFRQTTISL